MTGIFFKFEEKVAVPKNTNGVEKCFFFLTEKNEGKDKKDLLPWSNGKIRKRRRAQKNRRETL